MSVRQAGNVGNIAKNAALGANQGKTRAERSMVQTDGDIIRPGVRFSILSQWLMQSTLESVD